MLKGKCSWFGGPDDEGVSPSEGLAFIYEIDDAPNLFLPEQPPGTTGLARRLNPARHYIACRWDYEQTPKEELLNIFVQVRAPSTGRVFLAKPADWGPHEDTDRIADISPGLMSALGIETDDEIEVSLPDESEAYRIVISSGHGLYVQGAVGIINEVDEARRVVGTVVQNLRKMGVIVYEFHDDTSTTQDQNLKTIVNYHNSKDRDLDISVHFNAYDQTNDPMGTECLYVSDDVLASKVSAYVSEAGRLIDRGAKYRTNLYFLNETTETAILIETCFVDSVADVDTYQENFDRICRAIAVAVHSYAQVA